MRRPLPRPGEVVPGTRPNFAAPAGTCLPLRRPLPRPRKFCPVQNEPRFIMYPAKLRRRPQPPPNRRLFTLTQIAGRQTGACLPLRRLQDAKQAPVYLYADCRTPNRRLFTVAQIAGTRTGACLPLRRLQDAKQAPVYRYTNCRSPNRRLFTPTQIAGAKQAPVYRYTNCRAPNRRLFTLTQASAEAEEVYPGTRQTSLPPQGPCLAS